MPSRGASYNTSRGDASGRNSPKLWQVAWREQMVAARRMIEVKPGSELARVLDDPAGLPAELVKDGIRYRLDRVERLRDLEEDERLSGEVAQLPAGQLVGAWIGSGALDDDWEGYDPDRVRQVLDEVAGTLSDDEADRMIERIYRAREEGSRPVDRPGRR